MRASWTASGPTSGRRPDPATSSYTRIRAISAHDPGGWPRRAAAGPASGRPASTAPAPSVQQRRDPGAGLGQDHGHASAPASSAGPSSSGRALDGPAGGLGQQLGPGDDRAAEQADRPGHDVERGPQPPGLVEREPADHEQPQVGPHDLPVRRHQREPRQAVQPVASSRPNTTVSTDANGDGNRLRRAHWPGVRWTSGRVGSTGLGEGQRLLGGRDAGDVDRHRSTSCSRRLRMLSTNEITSENVR